jgi:uncharacterized membrane protein
MRGATWAMITGALLLSAVIFGFFYAWVCSTMWGLDAADPRVAITAMQAMNASVRNAVFAPAFFGTPLALTASAVLVLAGGARSSAALFGLSAAIYFGFGLILTMVVNVPMNEALAALPPPANLDAARQIWQDYSPEWQLWNQCRTLASALSFAMALLAAQRFAAFDARQTMVGSSM